MDPHRADVGGAQLRSEELRQVTGIRLVRWGAGGIAHAHGLHQQRIQRLARHHQHRAAWKHWLSHHRPTPLPRTIHAVPARPRSARGATAHHRTADSERQPNPCSGTALASPPRSGSAGVGECPSSVTIPAVVAVAAARPGAPARGVRAVAAPDDHEDNAWLEPCAQRAASPIGRVGERAPTTARATCPRTVVEIYMEASDTPIAAGRWLIETDSTVIYERPTGVRVASTVPASLHRHSPSWTCVFRRGRVGDSAMQCRP